MFLCTRSSHVLSTFILLFSAKAITACSTTRRPEPNQLNQLSAIPNLLLASTLLLSKLPTDNGTGKKVDRRKKRVKDRAGIAWKGNKRQKGETKPLNSRNQTANQEPTANHRCSK